MKQLGCFLTQSIQPLTAPTDFCASEGAEPDLAFEVTLNVDCDNPTDRKRMGGFKKLLADTLFGYQNQDLHDQLVSCQFYHTSSTETRDAYTAITGYDYPYFFPEVDWPEFQNTVFNDLFSGDVYPERWNDGTYTNLDGYFNHGLFDYSTSFNTYEMRNVVQGWPDNIIQLTLEQAQALVPDQFYYDGSNYYLWDYFNGTYVEETPGYVVPGYNYGDPVPRITQFLETSYINCSDELYYQDGCREPITLISQIESQRGVRALIAGTKSRIYVNDARGGNWRIIVDRLGGHYESDNCSCHPTRWKMAQLGDIVLFSNNIDPVLAWNINDPASGCSIWSADYILDLLSLDIETAKVVASWNGFAFIGNVVVAGEHIPSRLYWSDYNDPRSWTPGTESTAGYHDFGKGEHILAIEPIGGKIRVYTDRAIYDGIMVGGDLVFHFREIYRGPDVISYPNSIVNTGDAHFYMGEDRIWRTTEQGGPPESVDWIRAAGCAIYGGVDDTKLGDFAYLTAFGPVNQDACEQAIGGYDSERKTLWFSWPSDDNTCPNMSLVLNLRYNTSSLFDHGFTAFCNYEPDYRSSIRDWLAENGFCVANDMLEPKEGVPFDQAFTFDPPAYLFNETEDVDAPADVDSVYARLCDVYLEDLCREQCGSLKFVMASAEDFCLKEFAPDDYYREMLVDYGWAYDCGLPIPGYYERDGYTSMIQGRLGKSGLEDEKLVAAARIAYSAAEQTTPGTLYMQIAYGAQASCRAWTTARSHTIECQTSTTAAEKLAAKSRQSKVPQYQFYSAGVYIGWRFYVTGTGSPLTFNGLHIKVRRKQGKW